MSSVSSSRPSPSSSSSVAGFGTNEWLVEEMYQQYLADPSTVDQAWHEFFADYRPGSPVGAADGTQSASSGNGSAAAPAAPATSYASPAPSREVTPNVQSNAPKPAAAPPAPARPAPAADEPALDRPAADKAVAAKPATPVAAGAQSPLRGAAASVVKNMNVSLTVPTATSVRAVPAKLLADNRIVINNHLARSRGGKVSFTHLIGYALIRALDDFPNMNNAFAEVDGKPVLVQPAHVNFGLAIDLQKPDGSRSLVVANIKGAEEMDFARFWAAYEDVIRRARANKLTMEDFTGTTISLTNPGTIGTNHSVPRLTAGQGAIIGVGAMEYPAEFQGMNPDALTEMAVSKIITLTSTYDHRIIQGAESGDFLRRLHALLLGEDGFYDEVFRSLRIPYEPVRWMPDVRITREGQIDKEARVIEVIESYRRNGHLMADTDPL
ncbi:MAG: kgd, partial [Blastococcus sp.]|nr:kgd [Blastococcus sp.]